MHPYGEGDAKPAYRGMTTFHGLSIAVHRRYKLIIGRGYTIVGRGRSRFYA